MNCTNCGQVVPAEAAACPNCGTAVTSPAATASGVGPAPAAAGAPATGASAAGSFKFEAARWTRVDRITGIATLVLFISLFLPWFTYNYGLGSVSVDGLWHGWMYLVLLLCLAIFAYLVMKAGFAEMPFKMPMADEQLLLIATAVNAVLTILAFLFKPGGIGFSGIGWGFGAFIGLIAAIVAVAPLAVPAIQARRK
jgi:hypothetical protein